MEAQNWDDIYSNTEDYYNKFITAVIHIFQQSFPVVRVSRKRWHDTPWMTAALKASIKRKNLLYKVYLKHPSDKNRDEYNNRKNILLGVLKQAEIKYYENLFDEHKDSVYNMWKPLNHIINPKKGKSATVIKKLIIDRKVILEKQNISDDMDEHFCNVGEKLQAEIPDYGLKYMEYMPPRTANSFI